MKNTDNRRTIVKNKEWELAWNVVNNTDTSLFLTGKAGTGKTTFLRYLKEHTEKRLVVLAPTGIAAINARGVTIHSFFQLPFSPFIPGMATDIHSQFRFSKEKLKIIRGADLIVIDEISMVRADLLDAVDDALKRFRRNSKPFGGIQLLLIGDLQQLAPVVKDNEWIMLSQYYASPYFFDSIALKLTQYVTIELKKVFRQDDERFINILNKIRNNTTDTYTLAELNKRYIPGFKPSPDDGYIQLTTHNALAQSINEHELSALDSETFHYEAKTEGNYPEYSYPTDKSLTLKLGAQVMFVKNDTSGRHAYYNGMIGKVIAINTIGFSVQSKDDGKIIEVGVETWQNCKYKIDDKSKEIVEDIEGIFQQYPVRLAWAITIHKSQGLTFSHAIIDTRGSFAHGQTYVALSRCKTLEGLVLSSPITQQAIISDNKVENYTEEMLSRVPDEKDIIVMQNRYLLHQISDLFDFTAIDMAIANMIRLLTEHLYRAYPRLLEEYKKEKPLFDVKVTEVAKRFRLQYERMTVFKDTGIGDELQERISKGAEYFLKALEPIRQLYLRTDIPTNNKQIKKQAENAKENLREALKTKVAMLQFGQNHQFTCEGFLQAKANVMLGIETKSKTKNRKPKLQKATIPDSNEHPILLNELTEWRTEKMRKEGLPAYCILSQKTLVGISNIMPDDKDSLMLIPGIGKGKADKYGMEILSIVRSFKKEHE